MEITSASSVDQPGLGLSIGEVALPLPARIVPDGCPPCQTVDIRILAHFSIATPDSTYVIQDARPL
jgi:hypothetical protein